MRIALVLLLLSWVATAQVEKALESLYATHSYRQTALSPDGKKVAWQESPGAESPATSLYVAELAGGTPQRVTAGDGKQSCDESSLAWSPDSAQVAFLSNCASPGQKQLYVASATGGAVRKLTALTGFLAHPQWSPDGRHIALLFTENAVRVAGPTEPTAVASGVIDEKFYEQRITIVDPKSGQSRQISPADTYVYEYDWSPSSQEIAYTAAKGMGDNNWWTAQLFRIAVATGEVKFVFKPATQIAVPRWSPDGRNIAFIQGIMSDEGSTGGDVYAVSADGGMARNLTDGRKTSPAYLRWLSANKLLITERVDGGSAITTLNTDGATETLWRGDEAFMNGSEDLGLSLSNDGKTAAAIRSSWTMAPQVWAGPLGDWHPVTHRNDTAKAHWGEAKKMHWTSGGETVEGWLLYPQHYDAAKRYPMVVSVHGGPAGGKSPSWPRPGFDLSLLSGEGYFVLFPNPRGSYGGGERFTAANVKDFGYGDLADVLAGVDAVLKTVPVDESRIGIGGWSYGGYMTMWAVTQTHRFRAAVAGAGIANWQSYYGENSIDQWMIPYFGASVYDDPAVYAKSSPITYIKNVKTPTLIVVGDRDAECPAPQSYEFWHALKTLGVPTQFVLYPNEGHHFHDPAHAADVLKRSVAWFGENLK